MNSDLDRNPDPSFFPTERLPVDIQSRILSLLPITTLVVCKLVSRSWRSIITSPAFTASYPRRRNGLIFLLWRSLRNPTSVSAYLPSDDRWLNFNLPPSSGYIPESGAFLLLSDDRQGQFTVIDPFSRTPPLQLQPLPVIRYPLRWHKALALFQDKDTPSRYKILAVSRSDSLYFRIYDSRFGGWLRCPGPAQHFSLLKNAVYLDGLLCLTWSPDRILTLDPVTTQWTMLDLPMPAPHLMRHLLLVFEGELYLTGVLLDKSAIGIWELDRSALAWSDFAFMPKEYMAEFTAGGVKGLRVVDCMGIICYCNVKSDTVMCDMAARRWWQPQLCHVPKSERTWLGHAIEPYVGLLK